MEKEHELEQMYRSISNKNVEIDALSLELKQERSDNDSLRSAIDVAKCDANREKGLLESIRQLEKQLEQMEELRETTLTSLKSKEQALEKTRVKIDDLRLELKREKSDKECLRRAVEVTKCNAKREKELSEKTRRELENQLREMEELRDVSKASLLSKEEELQQLNCSISRKDVKIDDLTQELKQERSEKRGLKKTMEITESNTKRQRLLLDDKENEVDKLKELLRDYEKKIDDLNVNMKQLRKELEVAEDLLHYRQNDVGNLAISSRAQYNRWDFVPKRLGRNTDDSFNEMGSLMGHVGERLKTILQRQKEVDASTTLLKQKEAETERILYKLREELNQREDEIESLKKSVNEGECTKSRLKDIEHENIDLKRCLGDEGDKVKKLEIAVKLLEGDVERTQNSLNQRQAALEEADESLQIKCSLLTSMEAKVCLRDNEIEGLKLMNKEKASSWSKLRHR
ncbi:hypothetical protein OS493_021183 [Desmophyllum pertusum]|uniref:Uncharacterized protein n=1 Tax=Desmophyllum pertusum TaxID=174260 RepID=A0A9X0D296_9CNID|nr:hypothetical protein OS493_021183 [Desmophyllum pertusum]